MGQTISTHQFDLKPNNPLNSLPLSWKVAHGGNKPPRPHFPLRSLRSLRFFIIRVYNPAKLMW